MLGLDVGDAEQKFPQMLNFHSSDARKLPVFDIESESPPAVGLELEWTGAQPETEHFILVSLQWRFLWEPQSLHNLCFLMSMFSSPPFSDSFFSQLSEIEEGSDVIAVSSPQDSWSMGSFLASSGKCSSQILNEIHVGAATQPMSGVNRGG